MHNDDDEVPPAPPDKETQEQWLSWLRSAVEAHPAFETHSSILNECCVIAAHWRTRFWPNRAIWSRIRRGDRLVKEMCEAAPVLQRARDAVLSLPPADGTASKAVILDLCSGFGYLSMFLSELLAPCADRVEKIVLVDVKWA